MRNLPCFARRLTMPKRSIRLRDLLVWLAIGTVLLSISGAQWRRFVAWKYQVYADLPPASWYELILPERVWFIFALEIALLSALGIMLLAEGVADLASRRVWPPRSSQRWGHTSLRPVRRRYWYALGGSQPAPWLSLPLIVAFGYVATFVLVHLSQFQSYLPYRLFWWATGPVRRNAPYVHPALEIFLEPNSAGISLAFMLLLVKASLGIYLAAHLLVGSLPATATSRLERYLLAVAIVLVITSSFTFHWP